MTTITIHNIYLNAGLIDYVATGDDGAQVGPYQALIDESVTNPAISDFARMAEADAIKRANEFVDRVGGVISDIKAGGERLKTTLL